jgi:SAM-dependent methyltransferase
MPLAFHTDRPVMFDQQYQNARDYVIPFVAQSLDLEAASVLDIGCGDGGVLRAFAEIGCTGVGVDLSQSRVDFANQTWSELELPSAVTFVSGDIHDDEVGGDWAARFDLVILKDVIEHVPDKDRLLNRIRSFLKPGGMVFFGFPPWRMPFGGHQQITSSTLGKLPYFHIAPKSIYESALRLLGESEATRHELTEIHDTRISIAGFERLARDTGFDIARKTHFLFNPIYRFKFGLSPREQLPIVRSVPFFRDFVTTACYYLLAPISGLGTR